MRILVIDPVGGAAGDMLVGGLLAVGADREAVTRAMASVVAEPTVELVDRAGIQAIYVRTHAVSTHRSLDEVLKRVDGADAPESAIALARRVYLRLYGAESRVHGGDHVHFHEVGADDAIADVIGAATALISLDLDGVAVMPVALVPGTVHGAHGAFPLPSPATVGLLTDSGIEARLESGDGTEVLTPTGAALLAEFQTLSWRALGTFTVTTCGYGAGSRNPPDRPNVLRTLLVETASMDSDRVDVLETNVDDVTGEILAHTIVRLMETGARDAQALPALMKKGRMGYLVRVVCRPEDGAQCARILAEELGTLGVRSTPFVHRFIAERTIESVPVTIGTETRRIAFKNGLLDGRVYTSKPEFEQVRDWAAELGLPVRVVDEAVHEAIGRCKAVKRDEPRT